MVNGRAVVKSRGHMPAIIQVLFSGNLDICVLTFKAKRSGGIITSLTVDRDKGN